MRGRSVFISCGYSFMIIDSSNLLISTNGDGSGSYKVDSGDILLLKFNDFNVFES